MILGLSGNHVPFNRLVFALEDIAKSHGEDVCIQTGQLNYQSAYMKTFQFMDRENFQCLLERAEIVVSHGGIGCVREALREKKKLIVVPRLAKYKEHSNDHQLDICELFEAHNLIKVCTDTSELWQLIQGLRSGDIHLNSLGQIGEGRPVKQLIEDFVSTL